MNNHDRDNLRFLLTASKETLQDWYSKMDEDDYKYAMELLEAYSRELDVKAALMEDREAESIESPYPAAAAVLSKFRL